MQLLSLKTAIRGIMALADQQNSQSERQLFYLHTIQALTLLLEAPGECGPGWPRAALALLRPLAEQQSGPLAAATGAFNLIGRQQSRPLVEVMAPSQQTETQEYLLTILELPEIASIGSLSEVQTAIEDAISIGA